MAERPMKRNMLGITLDKSMDSTAHKSRLRHGKNINSKVELDMIYCKRDR